MKKITTLKTTTLLAGGMAGAMCLLPLCGAIAGNSLYPQRAGTVVTSPKPKSVNIQKQLQERPPVSQPSTAKSVIIKPAAPAAKAPATVRQATQNKYKAISTLETAPKSAPLQAISLQSPPIFSKGPRLSPLPDMPKTEPAPLPQQGESLASPNLLAPTDEDTPLTLPPIMGSIADEASEQKQRVDAHSHTEKPAPRPDLAPIVAHDSAEPYGIFDYLGDMIDDGKADDVAATARPAEAPVTQQVRPNTASGATEKLNLITSVEPVSAQVTASATPQIAASPAAQDSKGYLDAETRRILSRIPRGIDSEPRQSSQNAEIKRYDPDLEGLLNDTEAQEEGEEAVSRHESLGVAIEVRRPNLDVSTELQNAYDALISGQPHIAIQIYKDIVRQSSRQQDALFGLATTYHRLGESERARAFYVRLLQINPEHRDGLANFLALVAQDSPEEAQQQLEHLAKSNPDFSPIPAQLGALYDALGQKERALNALIHAVRLAPENMAYKYNLAVLYDKYGMTSDATVLYNQLLKAERGGAELPVDPRMLQERVIYINSNRG